MKSIALLDMIRLITFQEHSRQHMDVHQWNIEKCIALIPNSQTPLVIYCNHKDGAETITLEDIETALAEAGFGSDLVNVAVPEQIP